MIELSTMRASSGTGEAVRASVTGLRLAGSSLLPVDSLVNWPTSFIGTTGPLLASGALDPAKTTVFTGHTDAGNIIIDAISAGYSDIGSKHGDIVVIKPTTDWANGVVENLVDQTAKIDTFTVLNQGGWMSTPGDPVPSTVVYNGQRSYTMTFTGVDLTSIWNPGTRLMTQRTVAAPTQSTLLNGTNQFWTVVAPQKMAFTDDFVVDAYIKISKYKTSTQMLVSRANGVSGWFLALNSDGTIRLEGNNGADSNASRVMTLQSAPLNQWVRVTAQLDMSAYTATTTTSYIMFDGVNIPSVVFRGGTNPTQLVQAGNLDIGAYNSTTAPALFFAGKIAQVAIFNTKITQAQMRSYSGQSYTGAEAGLVSAYSFNGVATDLMTTTPNNLAAQNAAGYDAYDGPFGGQATRNRISSTVDYAIVTDSYFSAGNTTITAQVPEGCTIPTIGGIAAVSYSAQYAPYGFPTAEGKWIITCINKTYAHIGGTVGQTIYTPSTFMGPMTVPIGAWKISLSALFAAQTPSTSGILAFGLSYAATGGFIDGLVGVQYVSSNVSGNHIMDQIFLEKKDETYNVPQLLYPILRSEIGIADIGFRGEYSPTIITAECAYL